MVDDMTALCPLYRIDGKLDGIGMCRVTAVTEMPDPPPPLCVYESNSVAIYSYRLVDVDDRLFIDPDDGKWKNGTTGETIHIATLSGLVWPKSVD